MTSNLLWALALGLLLPGTSFCQEKRNGARVTKIKVENTPDGYFLVGPDPDSNWDLFFCARTERTIQEYLGLGPQHLQNLNVLGREFLQSQNEMARVLKASKATDIAQQILSFREEVSADAVSELFTTDQLTTLRQLALRLEVIRMGLPDALVQGRLSKKVGIHEEQKVDLWRKATEIEAETERKINELRAQSEARIFSLLSPEQRSEAERLLGDTVGLSERTDNQRLYRDVVNSQGHRYSDSPEPDKN